MERTPVELWTKILAFLLRTPLLPHRDATFAQDIFTFSDGCNSERLERELAQVACRLRLVCHSWNYIVQQMRVKTVLCNINPGLAKYVPPHVLPNLLIDEETRPELLMAQRLEMWIPRECTCGKLCRSATSRQIFHQIRDILQDSNPKRALYVTRDLRKLEVLLPWRSVTQESPNLLLDRLPNVKVIYWTYVWTNRYFNDIIHHRVHQNLTHLNIDLTWEHIRRVGRPIDFRNLHFLRIYIAYTFAPIDAKQPGDHDLVTWAQFPRLQRLIIALDHVNNQVDEITSFLKAVSANLICLILDFRWEPASWFMPDFWDHFPSLVEIGSGFQMIPPIPPPPITMTPLSLIYQLSSLSSVYIPASTALVHTQVDQFIQDCKSWRIERLTVIESWREAHDVVSKIYREDSQVHACLYADLYERALDLGIDIRDRDETRITEPAGEHFMEALRELRLKESDVLSKFPPYDFMG